jgi:hypothetical protein
VITDKHWHIVFCLTVLGGCSLPAAPTFYTISDTVVDAYAPEMVDSNFSGTPSIQTGKKQITASYKYTWSAFSVGSFAGLRGRTSSIVECTSDPVFCTPAEGPSNGAVSARSQASIGDTLLFTSTTNDGQRGTVDFFYQVDGTTGSYKNNLTQVDAFGQMTMCDGFCSSNNIISDIRFYEPKVSQKVLLGTLGFTFGVPFQYGVNLFTNATIVTPASLIETSSASADFGDTALFAGLIIRDSRGNVLSDTTVQSASGFDYSQVPEPNAAAMFIVGVSALLAFKRRQSVS